MTQSAFVPSASAASASARTLCGQAEDGEVDGSGMSAIEG